MASLFRLLVPSLADNQPPVRPRSPSPPPQTPAPAPPAAAAAPAPEVAPKPKMYRRQSEPSNELRMIRSAKGFLHIARQLGKGSFASVYEAWDSAGGQYAVKVR